MTDLQQELADLRERCLKAEAEADKWRNAHRSRVKCPNGHGAGETRGACPWCDAEANAAELARLREDARWRDAKVELPESMVHVWAKAATFGDCMEAYRDATCKCWYGQDECWDWDLELDVTHWRPLPVFEVEK